MKSTNKAVTILITALCSTLIACGGSNNSITEAEIGTLQAVKNTGIQSLFVANVPVSNGASKGFFKNRSESEIDMLMHINSEGKVAPVMFHTSTGKEVALQTNDIAQVGDKRLIAEFSAIVELEETTNDRLSIRNKLETKENRKTLMNMEDGKLYDFTEYSMNTIYEDNTVYTTGDSDTNIGTLFRIDLANISEAIPLNNPQFNPIDRIDFKIDNRIIAGGRIFDVNASFIPKPIIPARFYPESDIWTDDIKEEGFDIGLYGLSGFQALFVDKNNDIWDIMTSRYHRFFVFPDDDPGMRFYLKYKITIDDDGQVIVSDYSEGMLGYDSNVDDWWGYGYVYNNSQYLMSRNGTTIISIDTSGIGINVECFPKTMPQSLIEAVIRLNILGIKDNYLYWYNNESVERMLVTTGNTETILLINNNMVGDITLLGNSIMFNQYISATEIGTYSIDLSNIDLPPVQVSTNRNEIKQIVELRL